MRSVEVKSGKKKPRKNNHVWKDKNSGLLYARYTYTDTFGNRHDKKRRADSITEAKELYWQMKREHETGGEQALDSHRMTFSELADYCEKHYIKPPEYSHGLKVAGMRSHSTAKIKLDVLRRFFGSKRIREITYTDLMAFKAERLRTDTRLKGPRKISTVNRELSLLRRVLNVARREQWIQRNPFDSGGLISTASENRRTRVLSRAEETRLLAACDDPRRRHLIPIIICGIDTGMRSGEMFKLRWSDVNFDTRIISILAFNTKTENYREVKMTTRLYNELLKLWETSIQDPDALVFGITHRIKRGWKTACQLAGIENATPHDLRHTAATRMIQQGVPLAEVGRVLGHSNPATTYRYVNATPETTSRAADAMDRFNQEIAQDSDSVN